MKASTQYLSTVQTAQKLYETQDRPLLVMCSDLNRYVCKHSGGNNGLNLFCEYIAASFLKIWELQVPDYSFIKVNYEHVKGFDLPKHFFERTCFGSKYSKYYQELNHFTENPDIKKQQGYVDNRDDLLKIALFDLWLANEDRNFNNLNLLIDVNSNYSYVPIDHGAILNSKEFNNKIYLLSENESLVNTEIVSKLFPKFEYPKDFVVQFEEYFYICTAKCKQSYNDIVKSVPTDWDIKPKVYDKISEEIFSPEWEKSVLQMFFTLIRSPY